MDEQRVGKLERDLEKELRQEERTEQKLEKVKELESQLGQNLEEERKEEEKLKREIEAERHRRDRIEVIFMVNGDPFPLDIEATEPMIHAVEKVLVESGNSGRKNPAEWELRDAAGTLLDMKRTARELHLTSGTRLFLSPAVGAGGCS